MLQKLRDTTTGWVAAIIGALLIVPFAFFGINDYFNARVPTWVAKVGEREIDQQEFRERVDRARTQERQQQGENFDPRRFEDPLVKRQILDGMINEELLIAFAAKNGIVVPDAEVRAEIMRIPAFQVNGKFDPDQYRLVLGMQSMSAPGFDALVRRDLTVSAVAQRLAGTALVSADEVVSLLRLMQQTRDMRILDVQPPVDESQPDEASLQAWYEAHKSEFLGDETVSIEFVELDAGKMHFDINVDEAALKARYEENKARYVDPEDRLVSQILVKVDKDAAADAWATAEAKARDIVARAKAAGADFADIARKESDDVGSKGAGGDLGWMQKGATFAAFDDAMFALKPGEVSDPVRGEDGWHVILVREVKAGAEKSFAEVRDELQAEVEQTERERQFSEVSGRLMDAVIRDPNSLASAAAELGLTLQTAGPMTRAGAAGVAGNPSVLRAVFSQDLLSGMASDPIEVGPDHQVVVRVTDHHAAEPRPFAEVKAQVEGMVRLERDEKAGRAKAEALLARARAGESLDALVGDAGGAVSDATGVGRGVGSPAPAVVEAAFKLPYPSKDKRQIDLASLGGGRYALVEVIAVHDGDPEKIPENQRAALREQLARVRGQAETNAWIAALRDQFPVQIAEERM